MRGRNSHEVSTIQCHSRNCRLRYLLPHSNYRCAHFRPQFSVLPYLRHIPLGNYPSLSRLPCPAYHASASCPREISLRDLLTFSCPFSPQDARLGKLCLSTLHFPLQSPPCTVHRSFHA